MKEKDLKLAVSEYLEYGTNQGKFYADRLNSGEVIVMAGQNRRRVKLCREGTADFMVIRARRYFRNMPLVITPQVIFLELKGDKGKTSPEQRAFQKLIEAYGAEYHLIHSVEELKEILSE